VEDLFRCRLREVGDEDGEEEEEEEEEDGAAEEGKGDIKGDIKGKRRGGTGIHSSTCVSRCRRQAILPFNRHPPERHTSSYLVTVTSYGNLHRALLALYCPNTSCHNPNTSSHYRFPQA